MDPTEEGHLWADYSIEVHDIQVAGFSDVPRNPRVSLETTVGFGELTIYLSPEEAEELADELEHSARRARIEAGVVEGGGR